MTPAGERPHVLQVGPDVPGGMIAAMRGLLTSPLAEQFDLDVVATHTGTGLIRRLGVFAAALWQILVWSLRRRGRIVHIHSTVRGSMYRKVLCLSLAKMLRRRVVLHIHSGPGDIVSFHAGMSARWAASLRMALNRADVVFAVSSASRDELESKFGITGVEVVPNAAPEVSSVPLKFDADGLAAVFLGGFANPVKGGKEMLAAIAELSPGEPRLILAGPGELPAEGARLLSDRPGDEWRGWLEGDERERLIASASIFVLASTSEGLPMALLEAMARGQAIVATEVGGVPDVIDDGVEALLVPPGDPGALAAAIARLASDRALAERLGRAARERAAGMGAGRVAEQIAAVYRRLLAP